MIVRLHLCFLAVFLEVATRGHGAGLPENANDGEKCDFSNIVACLERQVRWIPKRFSERHLNKTKVTASEEKFLEEICRRNASECWRNSRSDGCVTEQQYTLDRFRKANAAALEELCKNTMENLKELYYDFLSWDIGNFKKCFASINISAVAQDIFSVQRSEQSCRMLLHKAQECTRNSYKKKTHGTNSTKPAEQILISFFNQMSCQELKSPVFNESDTRMSTAASVSTSTGGALLVSSTEIHGDSSIKQGECTSQIILKAPVISAENLLSRSLVIPTEAERELLTATTPQYVYLHITEKAKTEDGLNQWAAREATRAKDQELLTTTAPQPVLIENTKKVMTDDWLNDSTARGASRETDRVLLTSTTQYVPVQSTKKSITDDGLYDRTATEASRELTPATGLKLLHLITSTTLNEHIQEGSFDSKHTPLQVSTATPLQLKGEPQTSPSKNGPAIYLCSSTSVLMVTAVTAAANFIL